MPYVLVGALAGRQGVDGLVEQVLKLLALARRGEDVFGSLPAFRRWLSKPAYGLGGQPPLALLQTSGGIDLVAEEVGRIAYGDLA